MDAGRGDLARLIDGLASSRLSGGDTEYAVLLQESLAADVAAFARARGLHFAFSPGRAGGNGNAILSTLPLIAPRTIALPRARQPRSAATALIIVGEQPLFLASAHLENRVSWWRGGLLSDTARGRQAEALIRALPADVRGVLGGDMNTWLGPAEPAWRLFARRFPHSPAPRDPTFRDRLVLDHLFFDLPGHWVADSRVLRDRYRSNHHPVLGTIHPRGATHKRPQTSRLSH
jgi:endonuclease/exonuclease/phosphatase family metal-dependent hydrolase